MSPQQTATNRKARRWLKRGSVPALLAIGLIMSTSASPAFGIPITPGVQGGFEQDGDQDFDDVDPAATLDWDTASVTVIDDTPSTAGPGDDDTAIAGDDNDPSLFDCNPDGGSNPAKSNIVRAYVSQRVVNNEVFLDLAWVREDNNGSANVVFELSQIASADPGLDTDGPCGLDRTDGDVLITYDFGGQGIQGIRLWGWDDAADQWDEMAIPAGLANASVNTAGTIPDLVVGGNILLERFGEVTLNLTGILNPPGEPFSCDAFEQMRVRSRQQGEHFGNLSDRLPAADIFLSTCGQITIEKEIVGDGSVDFTFDPTTGVNGGATFDLDDDGDGTLPNSESFEAVPNVTHTVVETAAAAPEDLADYTTTINCSGTGVAVPNNATRTVDITVDLGEQSTCVYTNTRETGTLEVVKDLIPGSVDPDPGLFDLQIEGVTDPDADDVGDGGSTGAQVLNTGSYDVGEAAGTGTDLADYTSSITCRVGADIVAGPTAGTSLADVPVGDGQAVVCTITNTRETGTLEVVKDLIPGSVDPDPGLFDLQIEGVTDPDADDVGDGGSTGAQVLNTGSYDVGEAAGTGTDLADYTSSITCRVGADIVAGPTAGTSLADVPVGDGQAVVCTITNTRETGTLQVLKAIVGASGTDSFDLFIEADQVADDAGDGEGSAAEVVNTGTYTVSETAGTGTDLDNYGYSITCLVGPDIVAGPTAGITIEAPVGDGQDVVCTITNTRETGTLQVLKEIEGPSGTDSFDLFIEAGLVADDAGDGEGSAAVGVVTGTHTVSETAGTGTNLDNYTSSITCRVGADIVAGPTPGITIEAPVGDGQNVVCTITNTRETGRLTVVKVADPANPDRFNLQIDGVTAGSGGNVGNEGSTGTIVLPTGSYTVGETAAAPADLANYNISIACVNGQDGDEGSATNAGPLAVDLGEEDIICMITNTRKTGRLRVVKVLAPADDPGLFNLLIDGEIVAPNIGDGGSGFRGVNTGPHTVAETAGTDTDLADYTTSLACVDGEGGTLPSPGGLVNVGEEEVVCTFTNVALPRAGTIIVKKVADEYDTDKEFPFSSNFDGLPGDGVDFTLEAGEEQAFVLEAGTYSVTELVPAGWDLVSAVCSDQSPVNAINLAAEETVTCTFTNEREDYDDYPGDPDFDFDTPFDDAGDPGTPAPTGDTAGTNTQVGTQQPAAPARWWKTT